jgi:hypothetical protein
MKEGYREVPLQQFSSPENKPDANPNDTRRGSTELRCIEILTDAQLRLTVDI